MMVVMMLMMTLVMLEMCVVVDDDCDDHFHSLRYQKSFDFIASFSSLEHSGLGRYNDPLDPYGDFKEVQKLRCLLKDDGLFYLGFEIATVDKLVFNAHRIYGPIRLPLVTAGFRIESVFCSTLRNVPMTTLMQQAKSPCLQPVMVLRKN